jgi:N6-L-threonylcarbamoyladenine synthase
MLVMVSRHACATIKIMKVLGIESSCDETAAAVVEDGKRLLSNVVASSLDLHVRYGGVVPEIAARSHIEAIMPVIEQAVLDANCTWDDIDAIAVTHGAGLSGSLLIGVLAARTLAITKNKPLYGVNHVEGHLYANFLTESALPDYVLPEAQPQFPILGLIVSGGHSQLVLFEDHFNYTLLGQTQDDAVGEAFDKVGKLLGLPYPGGISVSIKANEGDATKFELPKAKMTSISPALAELRIRNTSKRQLSAEEQASWAKKSYDFSFSGIKTAVLRLAQAQIGEDFTFPSYQLADRLSDSQKADISASFQRVALETIVDKTVLAYREFAPASVIIGGGVASSQALRTMLADKLPSPIAYTDRKLCTDNGAMIATLGSFKHSLNQEQSDPYTLDIAPNLSM